MSGKRQRVAVIDLGTNTFHLLIADLTPGSRPTVVFAQTIPVKLGEGGINQGKITPEAAARGIQALMVFRKHIDKSGAETIRAVATSAFRTAGNAGEFIDSAFRLTGIRISVIDGDEEARIIYDGVRAAVKFSEPALIVDIGGGSVEFIIANDQHILYKESIPAGAARLMANFHTSDPISPEEIESVTEHLDLLLEKLKGALVRFKPQMLIGSAGAFETFAKFQDADFEPGFENPCFHLDPDIFHSTASFIIGSNRQQRIDSNRIAPVRTDMIVVATILTRYVIDLSKIRKVILSTYSLKEGVLFGLGSAEQGTKI